MYGIGILFLIPIYLVQSKQLNFAKCDSTNISCTYQSPKALDKCDITRLSNSSEQDCIADYLSRQSFHEMKGSDAFEVVPNVFQRSIDSVEYTGLNISVTFQEGVQGFLIWIEIGDFKSCRGIYLRKNQVQRKITLWYDCFFFLRKETGQKYTFEVISFPKQEKRSFQGKVFDPGFFKKDLRNGEFPLFLEIFPRSAPEIRAWFYESPLANNSSNYTVFLLAESTVVDEQNVTSNTTSIRKHPFSILFNKLKNNVRYEVKVIRDDPSCSNTCPETTSHNITFISGNMVADTSLWLLLIPVVLLLLLILIVIFFVKKFHQIKEKEETEVLVLYSYDNKYHTELVKAFVHLLRRNGFIVHFDVDDVIGNPQEWLKEHIFKENIRIILIWSKGAIYKAQQDHPLQLKDEPGNLTSHLFSVSLKYIPIKIAKSQWNVRNYSNIICILWDKPKMAEVSKLMPELPKYILPGKWFSLLYHLYYIKKPYLEIFSCCSVFQHLFSDDLKTYAEGKDFLRAYEIMSKKGDYIEFESNNYTLQQNAVSESSAENGHSSNYEESGYYSMTDKQNVTSSPDVKINDIEEQSMDSDSEPDSDEEEWLTDFIK